MITRVNRWSLAGSPSAYKTYSLRMPLATHHRPATCEEVDCPAYLGGWRSRFDECDPAQATQVLYIRHSSGRRFTECRDEDGLTVFDFAPGQMCFRASTHYINLEREPFYYVFPRDVTRSIVSPGEVFRHVRAEDWVDDCATHQQRIADRVKHG